MIKKLKFNWQIFDYNFGWTSYINLIDGWIARCSVAVPIVGYLIIFNDTIVEYISFDKITGGGVSPFYLDSVNRLRLLYFALISLGIANLIYKFRRPWVFKVGRDTKEFIVNGLNIFTPTDYIRFHGTIRHEGHLTVYGKYYDSEWEGFLKQAIGIEGKSVSENVPGHWNDAKNQYEYLLRCILEETFFRHSITNRISLCFSIIFSFVGYALLLLPSADLFFAVLKSMI
jgi:hypothetical protein